MDCQPNALLKKDGRGVGDREDEVPRGLTMTMEGVGDDSEGREETLLLPPGGEPDSEDERLRPAGGVELLIAASSTAGGGSDIRDAQTPIA